MTNIGPLTTMAPTVPLGKIAPLVAAVPLWVMLAAPLMAQGSVFPPDSDMAFSGRMVIETWPISGGTILHSDSGTATASITGDNGAIILAGEGSVGEQGGIRFSFRLEQGADNIWRELTDDSLVSLSAGGRLNGVADHGAELVTMTGLVGSDRFHLEILNRPHPYAEDQPQDYALRIHFDLTRPHEDSTEEQGRDPGTCRQIQWQTRSVPNLFGGGMDLIRAPVCLP